MVEKNSLPLLFRTEDLYGNSEGTVLTESTTDNSLRTVPTELLTIQTYYESMWIARGLNIKYMKWLLPKTGKLEEPDVEIELDDYRSYHRSKRSSLDKAK